ncbi:MAG: class I SAM-dependent methyltransferase [Nitrospira sp.]|nr:class I SAM-dependent methyltransferase [Nitrospira sp.]
MMPHERDGHLKPMDPTDTAHNYDAIASWWLQQLKNSTYGVEAIERTLTFIGSGRHALDIGCGCEGRFLRILLERGFDCAGLDISQEMIALAKQRYPAVSFVTGDVCTWSLPRQYDLITAWDSLFHLPLKSHEPVLEKL